MNIGRGTRGTCPPPPWWPLPANYTATREADSNAINCRLELSTNLTAVIASKWLSQVDLPRVNLCLTAI